MKNIEYYDEAEYLEARRAARARRRLKALEDKRRRTDEIISTIGFLIFSLGFVGMLFISTGADVNEISFTLKGMTYCFIIMILGFLISEYRVRVKIERRCDE